MHYSDLSGYDEPSRALNIWSFLLPPIGFVAYFALHKAQPKRARSAAHYALGSAALTTLGYALLWWLNDSSPQPAILFYAMLCWIGALSDGILIRLWRRKI